MTFAIKRGRRAVYGKAVAHIARLDPVTGEPAGIWCSTPVTPDLYSNVPWGLRQCKHCLRAIGTRED